MAAAIVPPIARLRSQRNALAASVNDLQAQLDELESRLSAEDAEPFVATMPTTFPPGHFYSPIPDIKEVIARADELFAADRHMVGVELDGPRQLSMLDRFSAFYPELPYRREGLAEGLRYRFDNPFFSYGDGIALYSMLRHLTPRRLVEVGSGWSSALTLDVDEVFLGGATELTFIEPFPERLGSLLRSSDRTRARIVREPLHRADRRVFSELESGDVLFIDSTHVSKIGSDVNQLILEVLPNLATGVHVHVHDIFFPFEYPRDWVLEGRAWNENYLLRAYLTQNQHVRISWFNSYLQQFYRDEVAAVLPWWSLNPGGSIWLEIV